MPMDLVFMSLLMTLNVELTIGLPIPSNRLATSNYGLKWSNEITYYKTATS